MKEEGKIRNLADEELEKVSGGSGEENIVWQDMICENGHTFQVNLDALHDDPENAFICPICGSTNTRRAN